MESKDHFRQYMLQQTEPNTQLLME